jgi:hypothetical protein
MKFTLLAITAVISTVHAFLYAPEGYESEDGFVFIE